MSLSSPVSQAQRLWLTGAEPEVVSEVFILLLSDCPSPCLCYSPPAVALLLSLLCCFSHSIYVAQMAARAARLAPAGVSSSFLPYLSPFPPLFPSLLPFPQISVSVAGLDMGTAGPQDVAAALLTIEQVTGEAMDSRCEELEAQLRSAELEAQLRSAPLPSSSSSEVLPFSLLTVPYLPSGFRY